MGDYVLESEIDNWDVPAGIEEEFATTAVAIATDIITVAHDIATGTEVSFTTTSVLPAGLVSDRVYYAIKEGATTITVASTPLLAAAGTQIDITDVGSGTHTIRINWSETFATTDVDISANKITVSNDIDDACKVRFSTTASDLPAPLVVGVEYYAINVDSTHIQAATTPANAIAGTNIIITDVGSGTHTVHVGEGQSSYDRDQIIDSVESLINKITKDAFISTAFVVYRNGSGTDYLNLGLTQDVLTVTEIKIAGIELSDSWYTYDDVSVYLDPEAATGDDLPELYLRLKYKTVLFPKGTGNIKITGTYGWSAIPTVIKQAAVILCKAENDPSLYPSYDSQLKSEKLGDYAYVLSDQVKTTTTGISQADDLLKHYIRRKAMLGSV